MSTRNWRHHFRDFIKRPVLSSVVIVCVLALIATVVLGIAHVRLQAEYNRATDRMNAVSVYLRGQGATLDSVGAPYDNLGNGLGDVMQCSAIICPQVTERWHVQVTPGAELAFAESTLLTLGYLNPGPAKGHDCSSHHDTCFISGSNDEGYVLSMDLSGQPNDGSLSQEKKLISLRVQLTKWPK